MSRQAIVKKKLTVSIIGAGRLGGALALALTERGYSVEALVSRHPNQARARRLASNRVLALSPHQLATLPPSKLILIATPDDVIGEVAATLATLMKRSSRGRTVMHTSGVLSSEALSPLAVLGFHTGSIHPLVSVSESIEGAAGLAGAYYCLEGDAAALRIARALVRDLSGHSFTIAAEHKALYHAAAVMASGHLTALVDTANELLTHCGLDQASAGRVLWPLIASAVKNLATADAAQALTGPFARGDLATVSRHLKALAANGQTEALELYRLLGQRSLRMMEEKGGVDPIRTRRIRKALSSLAKGRS
jgi:predicted short-subunit dehydrogenase-like oxidoreductase (DUF2520 family)